MKTYWDHTEKERSQMTDADVEALLKYELMEQGIVKVDEPTYFPVQIPGITGETYYKVSNGYSNDNYVVYKSPEDASDAIKKGIAMTAMYAGNTRYNIVDSDQSIKVEPIVIYQKEKIDKLKPELEKMHQAEKANAEMKKQYEDSIKAINKACEGIWNDYHELQSVARSNRRIIEIYEDYLKTCDGDSTIAMKFLRKAFRDELIMDAFAWFDQEVPSVMVVEQGA